MCWRVLSLRESFHVLNLNFYVASPVQVSRAPSIPFPLEVNQRPDSFLGPGHYPQLLQPFLLRHKNNQGLPAPLYQEAMIYSS